MAHYYQKKWVFTWNIDESGLLVDEKKLQNLLNEIVLLLPVTLAIELELELLDLDNY